MQGELFFSFRENVVFVHMSEKEKKQEEEEEEGEDFFLFPCSTALKWEEGETASWAIWGIVFRI